MIRSHMAQNQPHTSLDLAEKYWAAIAEVLYHPEEYDDGEWLSEVSELTRVCDLLKNANPSTPEERTRFERLLQEIRQAAEKFGFVLPALLEQRL